MRECLPARSFRLENAAAIGFLLLACGCGHRSAAMPPERPGGEATVSPTSGESRLAQPQAPATAPENSAAAAPASADGAPAAPPLADRRPTADRGASRPGEAEKITFDDLNIGMTADMVFRPFLLTDRVKELDGKRVTIRGYIHPGATGKGIKEFVLLRNLQCKFGAGGQADHLAQVFMQKGSTVDYRLEDVKIEGTLNVQPFEGPDGNTWSIYRLEDAVAR